MNVKFIVMQDSGLQRHPNSTNTEKATMISKFLIIKSLSHLLAIVIFFCYFFVSGSRTMLI